MKRLIFLATLALTACGHQDDNAEQVPKGDDRIDDLRTAYVSALEEARGLLDANGWLVYDDCDGFLWTSKYAAVTGAERPNFAAAEYLPDEPGRFARRPLSQPCEITNDRGSSWSRDMGLGLITYVVRSGDLALAQRHEAYGRAHQWQMGEPLGDGRAVYSPALVGLLYQTIFTLGGPD
jgi:hypothetical protein